MMAGSGLAGAFPCGPYEVVLNGLRRHQPVDLHWSAVEFEVEYATCTCGLWAGPGSCFESHRAEAIATDLLNRSGVSA